MSEKKELYLNIWHPNGKLLGQYKPEHKIVLPIPIDATISLRYEWIETCDCYSCQKDKR